VREIPELQRAHKKRQKWQYGICNSWSHCKRSHKNI